MHRFSFQNGSFADFFAQGVDHEGLAFRFSENHLRKGVLTEN